MKHPAPGGMGGQPPVCLFWFILSSTALCAGERTRGGDTFSHFLGSSKVSPPQAFAALCRTCSG